MTKLDYRHVSKTISHARRHEPWLFELELDESGRVDVQMLIGALKQHRRAWRRLTLNDLEEIMRTSDKQRFELENGRIRAEWQDVRVLAQKALALYRADQ